MTYLAVYIVGHEKSKKKSKKKEKKEATASSSSSSSSEEEDERLRSVAVSSVCVLKGTAVQSHKV